MHRTAPSKELLSPTCRWCRGGETLVQRHRKSDMQSPPPHPSPPTQREPVLAICRTTLQAVHCAYTVRRFPVSCVTPEGVLGKCSEPGSAEPGTEEGICLFCQICSHSLKVTPRGRGEGGEEGGLASVLKPYSSINCDSLSFLQRAL